MDINFSNIPHALTSFLHRYHIIVFVVVVFGALGLGIFTVYHKTLATDHSQGYTAQTDNADFDAQTIERIRKLYPATYRLTPDQSTEGREYISSVDMNPFVE